MLLLPLLRLHDGYRNRLKIGNWPILTKFGFFDNEINMEQKQIPYDVVTDDSNNQMTHNVLKCRFGIKLCLYLIFFKQTVFRSQVTISLF